MVNALHNRLAAFIDSLDERDPETLHDAIINEVIETGGTFSAPPEGTNDRFFELTLHGITAIGVSETRAIANWTLGATVQLVNPDNAPIEDDGFITVHPPCGTPRNSAEEIANAVAESKRPTASISFQNAWNAPFGIR